MQKTRGLCCACEHHYFRTYLKLVAACARATGAAAVRASATWVAATWVAGAVCAVWTAGAAEGPAPSADAGLWSFIQIRIITRPQNNEQTRVDLCHHSNTSLHSTTGRTCQVSWIRQHTSGFLSPKYTYGLLVVRLGDMADKALQLPRHEACLA